MNNNNLIPTQIICTQYNIEISFVDALHKMGLIKIDIIEHHPFIHQDQIGDLEKIIRLYKELNLNFEGIDFVLHLLKKQKALQQQIIILKNRLRLYESDF